MASIEYVVNATDAASGVFAKIAASADGLDKQLEDLGKRVADPEVNLQDAKFTVGMIRAAERLDKLSAMVADPKVEVDTAKAQLEILRINAMLDRLDAKRVSVTVDVDRRGGIFARIGGGIGGLLGGAGGAIGGAGGAISGAVSSLGQYGQGALYGIGGALAAALAPALLPLGIGALAGGGGLAGGLILGSQANKQLVALNKSLASAHGANKRAIQGQIAALQKSAAGPLGVFSAFQGLSLDVKSAFSGALTSRGAGTGAGPHYVPGAPSFLTSLQGILEQIGRFVKSIGPGLGDLFRASVPYLKLFVHFLEQAARVLLPVFTQMLKQMTPFLPLIAKGLMIIVSGVAGFIKAIGPSGMQAAAKIFIVLAKILAGVMVGLGHAINWLAEHIPAWAHNIAAWFDRVRRVIADFGHNVAVWFDRLRHDVAHDWDMIFQNTIGRVRRGWDDITHEFDVWRHNIAVWFDQVRHDIAHVWDLIWNNTEGRERRGIDDVIHWFSTLPGRALHALFGLGHMLAGFMSAAWNEMWTAAKNVGGSILHWITGWASRLWHGLLSFFHIGSPSGLFYDIGKNLMLGLRNGIQDHIRHASGAAMRAASAVASYGARTGSVAVEQRYAAGLLGSFGWPGGEMGPLVALWNRESGWNPYAVNPSSGAYGIPQSLGHGHPFNLGDYKAQIIWGLNYIRSVYGSPGAAWAHELRMGWYDRGGYLPVGWSMALNTTGRPERVGGGNTYNITVTLPPGSDREQGRRIVSYIRSFEQGSGAGWRS